MVRKVLTGIMQAVGSGRLRSAQTLDASTGAQSCATGQAPCGAPESAPPNDLTKASSRAPDWAPSGAPVAAPPNASVGAPLSATSQAPLTGIRPEPPHASTEPPWTDRILIPNIVGGTRISELVLLPLHPYTEAEMRQVVSESAIMCEPPHHVPLQRIFSGRDKIGPEAAVHAFLLIQWWRARGWEADIFARDLKKIYFEFCSQRGLEPQSWRKMAVYMNYHTLSPGRVYRRDETGKQLRYYPMGLVIQTINL